MTGRRSSRVAIIRPNADEASGITRAQALAHRVLSPAEHTARAIANKWKPTIITLLAPGSRRFGALQAAFASVAHKVLTEQLRQLVQDGVVARRVESGRYKRIHYSLTTAGRELLPILDLMAEWSMRNSALDSRSRRWLDTTAPPGSEPVGA